MDICKLINDDYRANIIFKARNDLIAHKPTVKVPCSLISFFIDYANGVKSNSDLRAFDDIQFSEFKIKEAGCVWASDGAESTLMKKYLVGFETIKITKFFPIENFYYKRDFQIALAGLILGYGVNFIGNEQFASSELIAVDPAQYEYSAEFLNLWNNTFPCKICHPLSPMTKIRVYQSLTTQELKAIKFCEKSTEPCGECYKCYEAYHISKALGDPICREPTKAFNKKMREELRNIDEGKQIDHQDIYVTLTNLTYLNYFEIDRILGKIKCSI